MRDIVYKNLTSQDRKRRVIASCEVVERNGIRSSVNRHFICTVREIKSEVIPSDPPQINICKLQDKKAGVERFYCKIKGFFCVASLEHVLLVEYVHSLKVMLQATASQASSL